MALVKHAKLLDRLLTIVAVLGVGLLFVFGLVLLWVSLESGVREGMVVGLLLLATGVVGSFCLLRDRCPPLVY